MIWAFLAYLFLRGGGDSPTLLGGITTKHLEKQVEANVREESRRDEALRALKKLQGHLDDVNEHHARDMKAFEKLVADYRSTPEDFDRLFEARVADRLRELDLAWNDRRVLLSHIRQEEWTSIIEGARSASEKDQEKTGQR